MKKAKGKKVMFQVIEGSNQAWTVLRSAMKWHDELHEATVGLAWRKETKADVDGHIVLGRCVKIGDLHKEFFDFDFLIVLNREYWDAFTDPQRLALVDHELCHATEKLDKEGEAVMDERQRKVWRVRKHDIEEFKEVIERHGLYKRDLEEFAVAVRAAKKVPLFKTA